MAVCAHPLRSFDKSCIRLMPLFWSQLHGFAAVFEPEIKDSLAGAFFHSLDNDVAELLQGVVVRSEHEVL